MKLLVHRKLACHSGGTGCCLIQADLSCEGGHSAEGRSLVASQHKPTIPPEGGQGTAGTGVGSKPVFPAKGGHIAEGRSPVGRQRTPRYYNWKLGMVVQDKLAEAMAKDKP